MSDLSTDKIRKYSELATPTKRGHIYSLCGMNNGRVAWYIIDVEKAKLEEFLALVESETHLDLKDYGFLIASGWGDHVPDNILEILRKREIIS